MAARRESALGFTETARFSTRVGISTSSKKEAPPWRSSPSLMDSFLSASISALLSGGKNWSSIEGQRAQTAINSIIRLIKIRGLLF